MQPRPNFLAVCGHLGDAAPGSGVEVVSIHFVAVSGRLGNRAHPGSA